MSTKVEEHLILLLPSAVLVLGSLLGYGLLVVNGVDRERALDSVTVALVFSVVAMLRGFRSVPHKNRSLEFGAVIGVLVAVSALTLRSVSLALSSSIGPLLYFTLLSSFGLAYVARRMLRGITRWATSGADTQPTPPREAPPRD